MKPEFHERGTERLFSEIIMGLFCAVIWLLSRGCA